jgi:type II secretory pathway pseudopilin PulG
MPVIPRDNHDFTATPRDTKPSGRCRFRIGATLVEMLVVLLVITIAMGMGAPTLMIILGKSDASTPANIIGTIHNQSLSLARSTNSIYGFTIEYNTGTAYGSIPTSAYTASSIKPWYVPAGGSITYYSTAEQVQSAYGGGLIANAGSYSFSDKAMPSTILKTGIDSLGSTTLTTVTFSSTNRFLHVAYEPGTGLLHASFGASGDYSRIDSPGELFDVSGYGIPSRLELYIFQAASNKATNRLILYPNGAFETKGTK